MGLIQSLCFPEQYEHLECFQDTGGKVRLLVVALDYDYKPGAELTCTHDAEFFVAMAKSAGITDITVVTDKNKMGTARFPTRSEVLRNMREVGKRCEAGDWFIWFFAGHGFNVPDHDGDEADGFDEAFGTPNTDGKLKEATLLIDDDFAKALDSMFPRDTRILCICDCCHSGTICDLDSFHFERDVYQISASQDDEEAEDTGKGGVLTAALKRAIQKLTVVFGDKPYSLRSVGEACEKGVGKRTKEQVASFQYVGTPPEQVAWPIPLHRSDLFAKMKADITHYEE